jgi:hypothetical protein
VEWKNPGQYTYLAKKNSAGNKGNKEIGPT